MIGFTESVVEGTLKPDGTLELDQKPNLPPGRVTIRLQPAPTLPENDPFFAMLKEIWKIRAGAGLTPRSAEEIDEQVKGIREEAAEEVRESGRLQQKCSAIREGTSSTEGQE